MDTVSAIIEGAAIQLALRFDVRRELTYESTAPTTIAAGTPRKSTVKNVNVSLAVKLEFVFGMRIGRELARITRKISPANSAHCIDVRPPIRCAAHTQTDAPAKTIAHQ